MAKSTLCPACRKEVAEVKKNPTLNNLIEKYLAKYPEKKRTKEDLEELDKKNKISADVTEVAKKNGLGNNKGRAAARRSVVVPLPSVRMSFSL